MGRGIALLLAQRGFHVFATVRRAEDGQALQAQAPAELTPLRMDVTQLDEIAAAREVVSAHVGRRGLDALVNNAGVGLAWPLEVIPLELFRWHFEVNVQGQLAVTQAFLPLIRSASGRVIMIGSIADRLTPPFMGPLSATKHALLALTEALRLELAAWNIHVVLIEPGNIRTEAGEKFENGAAAAIEQFDPATRALYERAFRAMTGRFAARHARGSSDPRVVADAVVGAIEAPRPRARYLVGKDALRFALVAMLPPLVLDPLRRKLFGLPRAA
jgi:NAD(P)-dependent dehydrogenase (short-subunit alcohol dehydrogenase family)